MKYVIKAGILVLNIIYGFMKLLPQQKKVVFLSRQSDTPSIDITMLRDKIGQLHPDYRVELLCKMLDKSPRAALGYSLHMLRQMHHLATAEVAILDSYCIAVSILKHRSSLLVVQMWHSVGTMKKFGYSILDNPEGSSAEIARLMKMHANYDYVLAGGEGYKAHLADGFNCSQDIIKTLPLPRVERLKDPAHRQEMLREILDTYPQLNAGPRADAGHMGKMDLQANAVQMGETDLRADTASQADIAKRAKKNIVYAPTFRKVNNDEFLMALRELCEAVDYNKYNLIIKAHPLSDLHGFNAAGAIVDTRFSSTDMLYAADIVISDYSCIIYEAAILDKPLYFYIYDYEDYMSSREVYMDYMSEVPGPVERSAKALMADIDAADYNMDRLHAFLNKYVFTGSKHETEDIVKFIFDHRKRGYR